MAGLGLLALPTLAAGATYYVNVAGDDGVAPLLNDCTVELAPCKTITHAAAQVPAGTAGDPNIIEVALGTYDTANGELFPIAFANNYVSLTGVGAATTTIDVGSTPTPPNALNVTARSFSVSGFTFSNASYAIHIDQGGFSIHDNIFDDTVEIGVYGEVYNTPPGNVDFRVDSMSFANNSFACTDYGVDVNIGLVFDGTTTGLTATIGNITATGNTFTGNSSTAFLLDDIYVQDMITGTATVGNINISSNFFTDCSSGIDLDDLWVRGITDSTVTWGTINVNNNTFIRNDDAIAFSGYFGDISGHMVDTSITLGNMSVSGNTVTDNSSTAINIDYFEVNYLYGTSNATLANLLVQNNTISADTLPVSGYGIYIDDIGDIDYIYDTSTVTTGTVAVSGNSVESYDEALYIDNYGIWDIGTSGGTDTVRVNFGPTNITDNPKLSSKNSYGFYLNIDYFGYDQYAQTRVDAGLVTVSNNTISSADSDGMYMYYYFESAYTMEDDAQLNIAGFTMTNNHITAPQGDGCYIEVNELGYDMYNNAKVSAGPTLISGNTIESSGEALYLYFYETALYLYNDAVFTMSPWTITNNTLTAGDSASEAALYIYYYDYYVGSYMEDDSSATLPDWIISNNTIDVEGGYDGIYYYTYSNPDDNADNAAVHFGSILIDNNIFNENKDVGMDSAVNFWIEDVCEGGYDASTFSHGDITVTNNTIYNVENTGINLDYDDVGYEFDATGKATMGDVTIADNTIDTAPVGIMAQYAGIYSEVSAVVTLGTLDITGNTVNKIDKIGIGFDIDASLDEPADPASLTIGKTTIADNTVTASATPDAQSIGININAAIGDGVVFAAPELSGNTVTGFESGIFADTLAEALISCNTLQDNSTAGLQVDSNGTFTAVFNSFIDNGLGIKIDAGASATVEAEKNWWGDAAGPAACATCNKIDAGGGSVNYTPWLASKPTSQCGGYTFPWTMFMPAITGMQNL